MNKVYRIKYNISQGEFSRDYLIENGVGGCDQVLFCSVIDHADGSGSYHWVSTDGSKPNKEMDAMKKLNCLVILAHELSQDENCTPGARVFCRTVFETFKLAVLNAKEEK